MAEDQSLPLELTRLIGQHVGPVTYGHLAMPLLLRPTAPIYTLEYAKSVVEGGLEAYIEREGVGGTRYFDPVYAAQAAEATIDEIPTLLYMRTLSRERHAFEKEQGKPTLLRRERPGKPWDLLGVLVARRGAVPANLYAGTATHVLLTGVPLIQEYVLCWGMFPAITLPQDRQILVFVRADLRGLHALRDSGFLDTAQNLLVRDP